MNMHEHKINHFWQYIKAVALVLLASMVSFPIHFVIDAVNLVMIYLAAVVVAAVFLGKGPAILASLLSVLTFDFFLIEPRLSFTVADTQYLLTFFGLLAVGLIISTTVDRLASQVEMIRQKEAHTAALHSLSQDLTGAKDLDDMLHSVVHHIHQSFSCRVLILLPSENSLYIAADSDLYDGNSHQTSLSEEDWSAALRTYERQVSPPTGKGDILLTSADNGIQFLALKTSLGAVGVLGVALDDGSLLIADESHRTLLMGFANLAALAIERAHLAEQASQTKIFKDIERLQSALLNSISHELRTPLVSITGALSSLAETPEETLENPKDLATRKEIIETAYEDARRMNLLVGNLLDMSRLESGTLKLNLEPCDLQDLIGISLDRFSAYYPDRHVRTKIADNLPIIDLDAALTVEVLVNLLSNAAKYSPSDTPIDLICRKIDGKIEIEISDRGRGVPEGDLEHIFDKFFRSSIMSQKGGLGLGLSISKGFIEAHNGTIKAKNRPGEGFSVTVQLPEHQKGDIS